MNSKSKKLLIIALVAMLVVAFSSQLLAHEIILDFPQQVESGEEVEIEFTFGHFPDYFDYEHGFFDTMEDGELMVVSEDGEVTELDFTKGTDTYTATFTPAEEGVYWIAFNGSRGVLDRTDGGGGMQLRYYDAKAPLIVGDASEVTIAETPLEVELVKEDSTTLYEGDQIALQLSYLGEKVSEQDVTVVTPSEQVRELTTDAQGKIEVDFDEEGRWFIHMSNLTDEDRSGEDYAENSEEIIEYDRVRYNFALYLDVEEEPGFFQRLFN
ncbi:DUF4198 domain-containing protein [Fuchsiella alkaliacetigena]|uniref:DUF4198 domain-containing protein n=1 Tax=Fuchsiella alkaliacetigena TaxID=957042 RepID=UPI00200AAB67|nr:DUF4198 domain-containing protein [Fuchsiella alkaliacetigena]MCK8823633.1 DUF4198 domain-containing protein [Fuchsiella alkaliacetigena]